MGHDGPNRDSWRSCATTGVAQERQLRVAAGDRGLAGACASVAARVGRRGGGRSEAQPPPAPADIVAADGFGRTVPLPRLAAEAWAALTAAARRAGHAAPLLLPVSGYRTVEEQAWLWEGAL